MAEDSDVRLEFVGDVHERRQDDEVRPDALADSDRVQERLLEVGDLDKVVEVMKGDCVLLLRLRRLADLLEDALDGISWSHLAPLNRGTIVIDFTQADVSIPGEKLNVVSSTHSPHDSLCLGRLSCLYPHPRRSCLQVLCERSLELHRLVPLSSSFVTVETPRKRACLPQCPGVAQNSYLHAHRRILLRSP